MKPYARIVVMAVVILVAFFSLPFWLPSALAAFSTPQASVEPQAGSNLSQAKLPAVEPAAAKTFLETSPLLADAPTLLLWSNRWEKVNGVERNDPKLVAWAPSSGEVLWGLDTGFSYGALADPANGVVYFLEEPLSNGISARQPLSLGVADLASGEVLSRTPLTERFFANLSSGAPRPILLLDETLYFTNYSSLKNLAAYDLSSGTLREERYDLCEVGYPTQWAYSDELNAFATLCIDFSTSKMSGSVTLLSLADGGQLSLDLPQLGSEEYMGGNGLTLGADRMAYVVDSDAGQIVEIDLGSMQITRQAGYAPAKSTQSLWQQAVAWLFEQAASPAAAKRMFSVTAISPDGSQLAVAGSYMTAESHDVYLIDLSSLELVRQLRLGDTPNALTFASENVLIAFYEQIYAGQNGRGAAVDLISGEQDAIGLPIFGYLSQLIETS